MRPRSCGMHHRELGGSKVLRRLRKGGERVEGGMGVRKCIECYSEVEVTVFEEVVVDWGEG